LFQKERRKEEKMSTLEFRMALVNFICDQGSQMKNAYEKLQQNQNNRGWQMKRSERDFLRSLLCVWRKKKEGRKKG
jgi:hypothetical protein